jgi:hypothetical protein
VSLLNFPAYDVSTESDVEQKFLYPLLTHPSFLAIPAKAILTKKAMGSLSFVDKTALPRNYIPDYVIFFRGLLSASSRRKLPTCACNSRLMKRGSMRTFSTNNFHPR